MNIIEIGLKVAQRRIELGLSQERLAKLSELSRSTIHHLEHGSLNEIGAAKLFKLLELLNIKLKTEDQFVKKHAVEMATQSVSVSYKRKISSENLVRSLMTGEIQPNSLPHIATLVDELPLSLIVLLVKEIADSNKIPPKKIWSHIYNWANTFKSPRLAWQ
jgi:transcriptional regulator with XRE-family HTH domain